MAGRPVQGGPKDVTVDPQEPQEQPDALVTDETADDATEDAPDTILAQRTNEDGKVLESLEIPTDSYEAVIAMERLGWKFRPADRRRSQSAYKKTNENKNLI